MLLLILTLVVLGILWEVVDNSDGHKAMKDYCAIECRQNLVSRCEICD